MCKSRYDKFYGRIFEESQLESPLLLGDYLQNQ